MSNIGTNIRNRRIELGMTQEELANRIGYKSKSTINKIELGINDIPQSKILRFAEVLKTTPKVLMGWEDEVNIEIEKTAISWLISLSALVLILILGILLKEIATIKSSLSCLKSCVI